MEAVFSVAHDNWTQGFGARVSVADRWRYKCGPINQVPPSLRCKLAPPPHYRLWQAGKNNISSAHRKCGNAANFLPTQYSRKSCKTVAKKVISTFFSFATL